jgi:WD40 repeat protein
VKRLILALGYFVLPIVAGAADIEDKPHLVLDAGGHTATVRQVLFTPDGKELITVSEDKTVRFWDVGTGEPIRVLRPPVGPGPIGAVHAAALSPDGKMLALSSLGPLADRGPVIYLIRLGSGHVERVLLGHARGHLIYALAFSPDGRRLASGSTDQTARIWDVSTGRCDQTLRGHTNRVMGIAFSPDGKHLATASLDRTGRIWSAADGTSEAVLRGHDKEVRCVAWSPDGKTLATGSYDATLRLWDADGSFLRQIEKPGGWILSVAISPDSRHLLLTQSQSKGCSLVDLTTARQVRGFEKHSGAVFCGAFSPDGSLAATAGGEEREVYIWRTADGAVVQRMASKGRSVFCAGWSQDGTALGWGNKNERPSLQANNPLERSYLPGELGFGPTPDDHYRRARLSLGSVSLERQSNTTAVVRRGTETISQVRMSNDYDAILCFSLLPNDRAVVGSAYGLWLFDTRSGEQVRDYQGHSNEVRAVVPSPDGRYLLSASLDQTLRVWPLDESAPLLSLFFAGEHWVVWTPEGYYAASPGGEQLMGWQVNNGPGQLATFYPASRFRRTLYRPDVIKRLLEAGSVEKALGLADRERGQRTERIEVAQVLPPKVVITTPKPGQRLKEKAVEVTATAESVGGRPVKSLQLLLDGRPCGEDGRKTFRDPKPVKASTTWTVELPPGPHRLAVKATSEASDATSDEVEVSYDSPGVGDSKGSSATLYVLAVGINAYPGRLRLQGAAPDARLIEQTLLDRGRGLFREVQTRLLTDRDATQKGIRDGLAWVKARARNGDVAVVFYAGHGDCQQAGQFYLLPVDVDPKRLAETGVSGEELKRQLGELPCATLLLLDACYAGSLDARKRKRALPAAADGLVREFAYDQGLAVLCGAAKEHEAEEEQGHGYFTRALVDGLRGKAARGRDGLVYLHHLNAYVTDRVKELSGGEQEPTCSIPSTVRSFPLARP